MRTRDVASLLAATVLGSAAAGAYTLSGPRWGVQQVPYYINPVNVHMSESDALAAIQAGAMAWTVQSTANILPYYMGQTSGSTISRNGRSEIFFRNGSNGNFYGEAYWWYDASYKLTEADVMFYSTYPLFSGSTGCSGGFYLEDTTAHEFGHVLGMGHSAVAGATMYPTMGWCSTSDRVLDPDDLAGIEALYPATAANTAPAVSISSPSSGATVPEGSALTLVGSASDPEDGNISNSVSWFSSRDGLLGTGPSVERVLSVGTHTLTAQVTDSKGATAEAERSIAVEAALVVANPTPQSDGPSLTTRAYKVKGFQRVDLFLSGFASSTLDLFRNGVRFATVPNTPTYTDALNQKGGGKYVYKACESGTATCSAEVAAVF